MSSAVLTFRDATRIIAESPLVRDRRYRAFPIGQEVGRFLRAKKARCRPNTLESYEGVLRRLTLHYAHVDELEAFVADAGEMLLDFLEEFWGDADEDTRLQRWAVVASFTAWAYRTDRMSADPMQKLERPRRRRGSEARRPRIPAAHFQRLVSRGADTTRDQAALLLLGRLGLRREDLRLLELGDIDLALDIVSLRHGKGGVEHTLPIFFRDLRQALYLHLQERDGASDEFLLFPKTDRLRPLSTAGIDGWFQRCMKRAGLSGYTMHQLRHAAIDDVNKATRDPEAARMLARHASLKTTQGYLHSTLDDLRARLQEMGV